MKLRVVAASMVRNKIVFPLIASIHLFCSAGEVCSEWETWSEYFGIRSIAATSLIQAFTYVLLAVRRSVHPKHCEIVTLNEADCVFWQCGNTCTILRTLCIPYREYVSKSLHDSMFNLWYSI